MPGDHSLLDTQLQPHILQGQVQRVLQHIQVGAPPSVDRRSWAKEILIEREPVRIPPELSHCAAETAALLGRAYQDGGLIISPPVYVELLAHPRATREFVDGFLATANVAVDFNLEEAVWREAGRAFVAYSRRKASSGGPPQASKRLLVDFLVGAHAALRADHLFTFDPARYSRDFPNLRLMP